MTVRDKDMGYKAFMRQIRGLRSGGPRVLVGVRGRDDSDLVAIAAVNEFGSEDGHVPERSYLRRTIDEQRAKYARMVRDAVAEATLAAIRGRSGDATLRRSLGRVGLAAVADVQQTIVDVHSPPNAQSTIAKKGSDNPLIDTGRLRQSIDFEVEG